MATTFGIVMMGLLVLLAVVGVVLWARQVSAARPVARDGRRARPPSRRSRPRATRPSGSRDRGAEAARWMVSTVVGVVVVAAVLVDRRRRGARTRGSGDDTFRDASYGEGAAAAQTIRRTDQGGWSG